MLATRRMTASLIITLLILLVANCAEADAGTRHDTARRLNRALAGTPMHGQGWRLEATGRRWNISPYFIALAANRESSLGTRPCRNNPRNVWGLKSCQLGRYVDITGDGRPEQLPVFRTWGHAFTFFARYVRARFPHARTAYDFHGYCECGVTAWAGPIEAAGRRLGWPTRVAYR